MNLMSRRESGIERAELESHELIFGMKTACSHQKNKNIKTRTKAYALEDFGVNKLGED